MDGLFKCYSALEEKYHLKENVRKNYYNVLLIYMIALCFDNTAFSLIDFYSISSILSFVLKLVRYVSYLFLSVKLFFDIEEKKINNINVAMFFLFSLVIFFFSKSIEPIVITLLLTSAYNSDKKKILTIVMKMQLFLIVLCIFSASVDIIPNVVYDLGTRNRESLGFIWPTNITDLFFSFICIYISLNVSHLEQENNKIILLLFGIISVLLFYLTDTKFVTVLGILFLITMFFYIYKKEKVLFFLQNAYVKKMIICSPFILLGVSILISVLYNADSMFWVGLDRLLSGRVSLMSSGLREFGLTIFGQKIDWTYFGPGYDPSQGYNYIDCSYLYILFNYGLVFTIVLMILTSKLLFSLYSRNMEHYVLAILFTLLLVFIEQRFLSPVFNSFLFLLYFDKIKCKYPSGVSSRFQG